MWRRSWNLRAAREDKLLEGKDKSKFVIIDDKAISLEEFIAMLDIPDGMAVYNVTDKVFYKNVAEAANHRRGVYSGICYSIATGGYYKDKRWIRVARSKPHNRWEGLTAEQRKRKKKSYDGPFDDFNEDW